MIKLLLYCTKGKPYLHNVSVEKWWWNEGCFEPFDYINFFATFDEKQTNLRYKDGDNDVRIWEQLNGKIVAECECDKVEVFTIDYRGDKSQNKRIAKDSCLDLGDLIDYQKENPFLYTLHLSNLKIFDKLLSFDKDYIYKDYKSNTLITKAPQNMCNVYDRFGNHYVLISIQPQHLTNILNGKKTIEIRKQILNCLKELI